MKPRINLRFGVWGCYSGTKYPDFVMGCGRTPKEAYDEWKARVRK